MTSRFETRSMAAVRIAALALTLCVLPIVAEEPRHPHGAHVMTWQPTAEAHFPADASVVEVPFRFELGKILVDVRVNGSEPVEMVLDTGAPVAVLLQPGRVDEGSLEIAGETRIMGAGGGAAQSANMARDVRFEVGDLRLESVSMVVMPGAGHTAESAVSHPWGGIFGGQLFSSVAVEIDWATQHLRLRDAETFDAPAEAIALPLETRGGHVFTDAEVTIDGKSRSVRLVVDTGASHALALRSDKVEKPAHLLENATLGRGLSSIIKGDFGRVERLRLGGASFDNVVTSFSGAGSRVAVGADGNLGIEVLRRFTVTFDYARDRMLLEPTDAVAEPFLFTTSGMRIAPHFDGDGAVGIDDVYPESPAARAGLSAGDRLVAVDSKAVADLGIEAIRDRLRQAPGTRVSVQVLQGGELRDVELELATVL